MIVKCVVFHYWMGVKVSNCMFPYLSKKELHLEKIDA